MIAFTAALVLLLAPAANAYDPYGDGSSETDIQLVCYGDGEKPTVESRSGYEWDADKHKYVPTTRLESATSHVDTAVTVSLHGRDGHIRLPKSLIPPIHSGDDDGWWPIDDLVIGHNDIRGQFRVNGMNKPRLFIDRRSGMLTIDGMFKFNGRCEPDDGHRRF